MEAITAEIIPNEKKRDVAILRNVKPQSVAS
jgi:hypothetical protein